MRKKFKVLQQSWTKFKIRDLKDSFKSQGGQAILIVVLIMVVGLTVGLALVSRSVTNVRTSTEEENSGRAFSAAEAGIEQALKENACIPSEEQTCTTTIGSDTDIGNFSNFDVKISAKSAAQILLNGGNSISQDDGIDLWLVPHNADGSLNYTTLWSGNLDVHWGIQGQENCSAPAKYPAALEIVVIRKEVSGDIKSERYAYDKCATERLNNFDSASSGVGGSVEGRIFGFKTNAPLNIINGIMIRIVPIYKNTIIGIEGNIVIPPQGKKIESVGKSGDTERKIDYFQGYPSLPVEFFPYILFAP